MAIIPPGALTEVTFLTGVNEDGTLSSVSYWNQQDGDTARKWGDPTAGTGATISYGYDPSSNWAATERETFRTALDMWAAVADITFVSAAAGQAPDILLRRGSDGKAFAAQSASDGSGSTLGSYQGQVVISIDTSAQSFDLSGSFESAAGYGLNTILHEVGHALGLGHGGDYNENVDASTQQQSLYDTRLYTLMSYIWPDDDPKAKYWSSYKVTGTNWGVDSDENVGRNAHTWMPLDILAIQRLYGKANDTPLSGETFGFNTTVDNRLKPFFDFTINTTPVVTLYANGGGNTLDLSGFNAVGSTVDMREGGYSSAGGITNNIGIAYGTIISRVITGDLNDDITGNEYNNTFIVGKGENTIKGFDGDDTLIGGEGQDDFDGGDGNDNIDYRASPQAIQIDLGAGTGTGGAAQGDTYANVERVLATSQGDRLTGRDDTGESLFGYGGFDELDGGGGDDWLVGGAGADTLRGGGGNDRLFGAGAVHNLIRNGSFDIYAGQLVLDENGYSSDVPFVEGWGDFNLEYDEFVVLANLKDGRYAFDLETSGNRQLFQRVLDVVDGVTYRLAFDYRKATDTASTLLKVQWGNLVLDEGFGASTEWQKFEMEITGGQGGPGQKNVLYFHELGDPDLYGTLIDNVRMWRADGSYLAGDDPFDDGGDIIYAGTGGDIVYGDGGDDVVVFEDALDTRIDYAYGGTGVDTLRMNWSGATSRIFYTPYTQPSGNGSGDIAGAPQSYETGNHDLYFAEFERFELTGGAGNDVLVGGYLDDILNGGAGNDRAILKLATFETIDRRAAASETGFTLFNGTRLISIESMTIQTADGNTYDLSSYAWESGTDGAWTSAVRWDTVFSYPHGIDAIVDIDAPGVSGKYTVTVDNLYESVTNGGSTTIESYDVGTLTIGADANLLVRSDVFRIGTELDSVGNVELETTLLLGRGAESNSVAFKGGGTVSLASRDSDWARIAGDDSKATVLDVQDATIRVAAGMETFSDGVTYIDSTAGAIDHVKLVLHDNAVLRAEDLTWLIVSDHQGIENHGLIEAVGRSQVDIYGGVIDQRAGSSGAAGEIRSEALSLLKLDGVAVKGGTLNGAGFGVSAIDLWNSVLDGVDETVVNAGQISVGATLRTIGTLTNTGGISVYGGDLISKGVIQNTGSITITDGRFLVDGATASSTLSLNGTGSVSLRDGQIGLTPSSLATTLTNNSTIYADEGINTISGANLTFVNGVNRVISVLEGFDGPTSLTIDTGADFRNDGRLESSTSLVVQDAVTGNGSLFLYGNGKARFTSSFFQATQFTDDPYGTQQRLDVGQSYSGPISGFGIGDKVDLDFVSYSGSLTAIWQTSSPFHGVLSIKNGGSTVATLNLNGSYASNRFSLSADADGSTVVTGIAAPPPVAGSVSINDVSVTEGNAGAKLATFTVARTGGTAAFSVNYATADAGATAGHDYVTASGTLSFAAGDSSKTFTVTIVGDTVVEGNEAFLVNLSGATNGAVLSDAQGTGLILNDDAPQNTPTPGNDVLTLGPSGPATLDALAGDDHVTITGGVHTVFGSAGNDTIT
ncbi:Calx-beta domain-containing protein, partial [Enterovirga sp. CN4-39]|uniref:Calx-beta domain-containing protein n=1 Tax=Enterovirga sp. CN4-39 TaxID=3400910 RepID=UPI003C0E8D6B